MMRLLFLLTISVSVYCSSAMAEKNLMRLFYTPAERALIDANRKAAETGDNKNVISQPRTELIEVNGYLKRKDQPDVVWVNGKNTLKSSRPLNDVKVIKVLNKGQVSLRIKDKGRVNLKPGQAVKRSEQGKVESYEIR